MDEMTKHLFIYIDLIIYLFFVVGPALECAEQTCDLALLTQAVYSGFLKPTSKLFTKFSL